MTDKVVEFPKKTETDPVKESVASTLGYLADIRQEGEIRGFAFAALTVGEDGQHRINFDFTEHTDDSLALGRAITLVDRAMSQAWLDLMTAADPNG